MRPTFRLIAAALAALAVSSIAPPTAEAQVPYGNTYAVVAPTYPGATQSYLRLFNGAGGDSTFSVKVVGSPSARTYGNTNITVKSRASKQIALEGTNGILDLANAPELNSGDTSYALYIQNADYAAGYQHVTYNADTQFFENNSLCKYLLNDVLISNQDYRLVLINVHSSLLGAAGYPARIAFHNYWNTLVNYTFGVFDASTGAGLGEFVFSAAANATYQIPMTEIESRAGFTATQIHLNILVTDGDQNPPAMLGQSVVNEGLQNAQINMSTICAVNATNTTSSGGGGTGGLGGW